MARFLLFTLVSIFCLSVKAQQSLAYQGNRWTVTSYGSDVVKLTLHPDGYKTNENITDAVISKPAAIQPVPVLSKGEGGGVILSVSGKTISCLPLKREQGEYGFRFPLRSGEKIFGGGSRALPLNRRGYAFALYNNPWYGYEDGADNLNFSVPFFQSSEGYALFFDNPSKGFVDIGKSNAGYFDAGFSSGELNVYIIFGKDYRELLKSFTRLTGKQPLPPRWMLGNFMSRFGYVGEGQMKEILGKMQQQQIPVDAIVFDLFWFGDSIQGTLGNLEWENRKKWPDPAGMMTGLRKQSIKPILITEPFFLKGTRQYNASAKYLATDSAGAPFTLQDFYFGKGGILDIFRKDAADWIWNTHYRKQIGLGTVGWWTDLGEPEKHPAALLHNLSDLGYRRKFGADEVHNAYGHYWSRMLWEKYAKDYPDTRLFHLARSGFAGSQRYGIFPWSGDVSRSWKGFQAQLNIMQGMSMSGIPYMHSDAGGFAGGNGDQELYVRWLQYAAFTPVFRPHGTALKPVDPRPFDFASEPALMDTPYNLIAKSCIDLRYRMLPYNYTLCYLQAKEGAPLTAPLSYYFPEDSASYRATDQYLWGSSLLIAPVTEKGLGSRRVYLPGGNWYRLSNTLQPSGAAPQTGWVDCPLSIGEIPFYARAGSFLPTREMPSGANTERYVADTLVVHYFKSDTPSEYVLFDDDGKSKSSLVKGKYQLISLKAVPLESGRTRLEVSAGKGMYPGMPKKRVFHFVVHRSGQSAQGQDFSTARKYSATVSFTGKPLQITVQ